MTMFKQAISEYVWDKKYRYKIDEKIIDANIEETWWRVAKAAAQCEVSSEKICWTKKYFSILQSFNFIPGGRILSGAGINRNVTLMNCFVNRIKTDSLIAIFNALKNGAITLQQGGGIGIDFSILRPKGYRCKSTNSTASGPLDFMRIWNSMSSAIQSSGERRGAMMGHLRCDHPDIYDFIEIKSQATELRQFNLSVIVTDEFMQAVNSDSDWHLIFPTKQINAKTIFRRWSGCQELVPCRIITTIRARDLWKKIITSAYNYAEPGVIFEDIINQYNPLWYCEWLSATNPCGEIPLPFDGACNLGSVNLTQFISNPFSERATFNWSRYEETIAIATRFLDNIISITHYPLPQQKKIAYSTRRMGLGFTGLASSLFMLKMAYGDSPSLEFTASVCQKLAEITWETSTLLAREKGSFPLYNEKKYLNGLFVNSLSLELKKNIKKRGMRNSHHNAIAPAGSISLLANNISSGIEPIFSSHYSRRVKTLSEENMTFDIQDYAYFLYRQLTKLPLPLYWRDVRSLLPADHLAIQRVVQPFIDNAISKTINIPENFPLYKLTQIYQQAYEHKLKGCTIFRPNPITGEILSEKPLIDPCCY